MTDHLGSHISQAHGAVHSGPGDQYNLNFDAAAFRLSTPRAKASLAIAYDDRLWLHQRFVYPPGLRRARDLLRDRSAVLLTGQPGSGRRAAALILLHELSEGAGNFHELPDTADDTTDRALDPALIGERDRLLLDLSNSDTPRYNAVQAELSDFRTVVERRSARLVVVLPQHLGYLQHAELHGLTTDIERPRGAAVLMRHLRLEGIRPEPADVTAPQLAQYLAEAPLRDVARLADLIRRERDAVGAVGTFCQWRDRAMTARAAHHRPQVADFLAALTGRQRVLAFSLAMFHGCAPDTVFRAAAGLQGIIGPPPDERPRLEHTDLTAEFKAITAGTEKDGGVRFRVVGYDAAIRAHFWTYFPDLRERFRNWVRDCVNRRELHQDERSALISRFAEQCLANQRPSDLWWLAEQWTRHPGGRLLPDASQALAEGLEHDEHGRAFRQKIYDWSLEAGTSRDLRQALVLVCARVMAVRHPDQALVRLHHLTRASHPGESKELEALIGLARSSDRLFRLLLGRLQPERHPADSGILLALAAVACRTRRLFVSLATRERLTTGWAAVLRHHPYQEWRGHLADWLTGALASGTHRDALLDVVVSAAAPTPGILARLHVVARDWASAAPSEAEQRGALTSALARRIDAAEGLEPAVPSM